MATQQLTKQEIDALLDEHEEDLAKEAAKATYGDVIKSGGIRILAGPAQAFLGSAEVAGLVDKGSTAKFTQSVLEAEKMGEMDIAQTLLRDTLAQSIPIAAEVYATRGRSLLQSLKPSAGIGTLGGFYTFIEDPKQAAALSSARMYNTIVGGAASALTTGAMMPLGYAVSSIRGARGALDVAGPDIRPSEINADPQSLRDAAYGLGSTKSEAIRKVVLPAALPGVVASVLLAVSRAVGETMIVVMAAGLAANLSLNPLDAVTTVTSQIVTILVGDQEFESAKTLSAFALALTLIVITLGLNFGALQIVKKYREQYE